MATVIGVYFNDKCEAALIECPVFDEPEEYRGFPNIDRKMEEQLNITNTMWRRGEGILFLQPTGEYKGTIVFKTRNITENEEEIIEPTVEDIEAFGEFAKNLKGDNDIRKQEIKKQEIKAMLEKLIEDGVGIADVFEEIDES